ncbi:hypothetical protein LTR99_001592 [Exophiala xenobiotica]|uniref:HTH APSES-type domain-containing protein n=1 Tax=Vermiconidia calcicola TaxID=1690605 RepID=A0AAV9QJT0_9PEZI|nr:hypothetical protein H2202_004184 [Exophiala xenobiotica]KAK5544101.1 hypothetical protein LTR25_001716 [Vermiconidia calcicola]KAK5547619.1 hypothetical protein LTR23_002372 [Chaetothyriales sp. CCFEE 6169]KAK5206056.1 hypothetical protein LTR41_008338 [Exophiala xenobiotica]KAK5233896.1 hypothetical protein LTR47_005014 [Exophiala xenobiotica]
MNQAQPYMDMHPGSHISSGPSYSHPATAPMGHYQPYQQPPILPPASAHYPHPQAYSTYGYANGITSPQSAAGPVGQPAPLSAMITGTVAPHFGQQPNTLPAPNHQPFDTTGQVAPPGMKPRVTATLWEDEGSLCFQVEAKGVCVARREDNHFINGTKLLNVAGMTRGRRDGILKSEKTRHVVKIGPMHLKGVWIPFERALEFANKEKITDLLYPLFVHNIGGLLYNPENAPRTNTLSQAAAERRRIDSVDSVRPPPSAQTPSLQHHNTMPANGQGPPTPQSIVPHPNQGRPGIDRAHTFPTPPTSASSVMGMGNQGSSYDWGNQSMQNGTGGGQPLSIETGLNARSMPTTPATTPPGNGGPGMQSYQGQSGYDSKHYYSTTPSSQTGYAQQPDGSRYGQGMQSGPYGKSDMGPPLGPGNGVAGGDGRDGKADAYGPPGHGSHHESDHPDSGYMSANASAYNSNRGQYAYGPVSDHPHMSPEQLSGSPPHQGGSGHATPRTMPSGQPQWASEYHTPPRVPNPSNVYNMGHDRTPQGGPTDTYGNPAYSSSHPAGLTSAKRGREDDDQDRPGSRQYDGYDSKRRKMGPQETFGMPLQPPPHMQAIKTGGQR